MRVIKVLLTLIKVVITYINVIKLNNILILLALPLRMANWRGWGGKGGRLGMFLQVQVVDMQQWHDSLLLILVISMVSHIRRIFGVDMSYTACRVCKRELVCKL